MNPNPDVEDTRLPPLMWVAVVLPEEVCLTLYDGDRLVRLTLEHTDD